MWYQSQRYSCASDSLLIFPFLLSLFPFLSRVISFSVLLPAPPTLSFYQTVRIPSSDANALNEVRLLPALVFGILSVTLLFQHRRRYFEFIGRQECLGDFAIALFSRWLRNFENHLSMCSWKVLQGR